MEWDINRIREVIKDMDKKTGLNGSELDIIISGRLISTKGRFRYYSERKGNEFKVLLDHKMHFEFSRIALDGRFDDQVVIDLIQHEYIHYYCAMTYPNKKVGHGIEFKLACMKFGVNKETYFTAKIKDDFTKKSAYQKCYIVICQKCNDEIIRVRKSSLITNIEDYRCGKCNGKYKYHVGYRIID